RIQSIFPIICSLTVYPANAYLLLVESSTMRRQLKVAYLINLVAHIAFDWVYSFFLRMYGLPPYGLFYCDGIICGMNKKIIMGAIATSMISVIPTFYFIMMGMHQMVVAESESKWKLSCKMQLFLYASLSIILIINVVGFVNNTQDVANFWELVNEPELAWLSARGGTLLLFGEPGVRSEFVNGSSYLAETYSIF
ncbi:hypothetical protein PFISCL1PPCAC_14354, partial [Pristionchus fissidentatus]